MIYKVFCEDDYEIINPVNKNDYDLLNSLDGIPGKNIWHDFEVTSPPPSEAPDFSPTNKDL